MSELWTERLHLRPLAAGDFEAHARITADAEVMRWISAAPLSRTEAWWNLARYVGHWQLRGHGMWGLVERASGELVGHAGFLEPEGDHGFELGWALARDAWGRGYALEAARSAVQHAFAALGRDRITIVIRPENERSIRIAERLGARLRERSTSRGAEALVYVLTQADRPSTSPARNAPADRPER